MARSQNGWPVVGPASIIDKKIRGVEFPNGWLKGDVDVLFTDLITWLDRNVEAMHPGWCWGYFVKGIEGSDSISNHASGTAFDYNAPDHPMGVRNTFTATQRSKIRARLATYNGVIRWGGDYTNRPDDMHFEIDDNASAVKREADKVRNRMATQFNAEDRDVLKQEAEEGSVRGSTQGVLSYAGGGLPEGSANVLAVLRETVETLRALKSTVDIMASHVIPDASPRD